MNESVQRKFGAGLSYISIISNTLVQLLYTPFLTKMLGQSEYGLYSLVASIIGYLTVLDLGFGNAIIVYTTKYGERKYIVDTKKEILETDWSNLEGTSDNRLTLITCIKNKVNQRLCVQAVQENI